MNDLMKQITPLTRAIIWIVKDECQPSHPFYAEIDYILDGILTANLKANKELSSRVIVGKNFDKPIYVMIVKDIKSNELQSFATLVKQDLGPENDILVLDEAQGLDKVKSELKSISGNIKVLTH
jgi:hypothetical protein